jgi:hypothetical protein
MKKFYANPVRRELKTMKKTPLFSKEQLAFYEDFHKNTDRLEREWNLCRTQYDEALKLMKEKSTKFDTRMALQKIAKYWNARKIALEKTIGEEVLKKFKEKRNESERTDAEK